MPIIRPARQEDLVALRGVAVVSYQQTFGPHNTAENMEAFLRDVYSLEQFEKEFLEPQAFCYLAWEGESLAGFLRLRINDEASQYLGSNTVELHRLYLHPDFQGRKIGSKLMEIAISKAQELRVEWMWLGVWERNYKAQAFYSKWGFEKFGEHIFQMGDDPQIDWLMKKKIT
jgi:diamine N-acetyltransferase